MSHACISGVTQPSPEVGEGKGKPELSPGFRGAGSEAQGVKHTLPERPLKFLAAALRQPHPLPPSCSILPQEKQDPRLLRRERWPSQWGELDALRFAPASGEDWVEFLILECIWLTPAGKEEPERGAVLIGGRREGAVEDRLSEVT